MFTRNAGLWMPKRYMSINDSKLHLVRRKIHWALNEWKLANLSFSLSLFLFHSSIHFTDARWMLLKCTLSNIQFNRCQSRHNYNFQAEPIGAFGNSLTLSSVNYMFYCLYQYNGIVYSSWFLSNEKKNLYPKSGNKRNGSNERRSPTQTSHLQLNRAA